jgi:4'-phosphopantetheinyl transferase EntD
MVSLYWFERGGSGVPAGDAWLSQAELACVRPRATPKRRSDWRHGRWAAKQAAARYLGLPSDTEGLREIQVIPADSGAPELFRNCEPLPATISITHGSGRAACLIGPPGIELGCDLEVVEARSISFIHDWFTAAEQEAIANDLPERRHVLATAIWSAKECALKALAEGLRLDTRSVDVHLSRDGGGWASLAAVFRKSREFTGWWHADRTFVRAVLCSARSNAPEVWN